MTMIEHQHHDRFKDAPWYYNTLPPIVLIGGAGGIGSWVALLLSRANFRVMIYDFDRLEEGNLAGQLYPVKSIGLSKIAALQSVVKEFSGDEIYVNEDRYVDDSSTNNYVISAFDNMAARRSMFNNWKNEYAGKPNAIFIDGRLQAEHMQIYCVRSDDSLAIAAYETDELFPDSDVPDAPCTMKQTSHAAAMIASHIVGFFTNYITYVKNGDSVRSVPYRWEYFIPMNYSDCTEKLIDTKLTDHADTTQYTETTN